MSITTLIEASGLAKAFGSVKAVDDVTLQVGAGSIVGLLGVNGAGKSTLMRLLAGALRPDGGATWIAGADVASEPAIARSRLGYLPEAAAGFGHLTVFEFLSFAAEGRGIRGVAATQAIAAVAARLDLEIALNSLMGTLSKGWRQRAWLAQAAIHDPPVLLLDEPADGLDPAQKSQLRTFLRSAARDKAIVLSTHSLEDAEALCDRIVIVSQGRVAVDAPCAGLSRGDGGLAAAFDRATSRP